MQVKKLFINIKIAYLDLLCIESYLRGIILGVGNVLEMKYVWLFECILYIILLKYINIASA